MSVILFLAAAHGFALGGVLLSIRHGHRTANRLLAGILFAFSLGMVLHTVAMVSPALAQMTRHPDSAKAFFLLVAPLFYLYTRALSEPDFTCRQHLWHLVPFVLAVLALTFPKGEINTARGHTHSIRGAALSLLILIQNVAYIGAMFWLLRRQTHLSVANSKSRIGIRWLRFLFVVYTLTWFAAIAFEISAGGHLQWNYFFLLVAFFIFSIGYQGLRQPAVFAGIHEKVTGVGLKGSVKYQRSTLKPEMAAIYFERLQRVMEQDQPHLEPDISLPELARRVGISTNHLSQIINEHSKQNFFDFISHHRVEAAKKLISEPRNRNTNLAEIAHEAGFNTLSSFNAAFRKHTGLTPSDFRQRAAEENDASAREDE